MSAKQFKKNIIAFDIDSTTVGGGIFEYSYQADGKVTAIRHLFEIRENITNGQSYPFSEFWRRTKKTFDEVAYKVLEQSLIPFEDIYVNVSAPWTSAQKRTIRYAKEEPFEITKELIHTLIEKELHIPLSKNLDYHDHKVSLIDRRTIKILCDGYPVRDPFGKKAQDLSLESLVTVLSDDSRQGFEEVIEKHFHRHPRFLSNIFVAYDDVIRVLPNVNNALVVDVSGSMTEMFVLRHDYLEQIAVFPLGIHTLVAALAHAKNITHAKAHKLIRLAHEGELNETYTEELQAHIQEAFRLWLKGFYEMLDSITQHGLVNNTMVLKIDRKDSGWFSLLLMSSDEILEHMRGSGRLELINIMDARESNIHREYHDDELALVAECIGNHHLMDAPQIL